MKARTLALCGIALGLLLALPAEAQTTVITQPQGVTTNNVPSASIASGGTYQSVFAADTSSRGRVACTVINYGTHTMYVFAGAIASATHARSVQLAAGQAFYCATASGGVLKDQISVDGTTSDAFYAAVQ